MRTKKLFQLLALIAIWLSVGQIAFAVKNALPENWRSFVLNLHYNGKNLIPNPGFPNSVYTIITAPQPVMAGDFKIEIYSIKKELLFSTTYEPRFGANLLYLPYYLNAAQIKIFSPLQELNLIDVSTSNVCNENNICELGEENLCPLDCKSARNPNYPLTPAGKISDIQKSQPQPLEKPTTTFTSEFARNQFQNYLVFLGVGIGFLLMLFGILNWYNKRK